MHRSKNIKYKGNSPLETFNHRSSLGEALFYKRLWSSIIDLAFKGNRNSLTNKVNVILEVQQLKPAPMWAKTSLISLKILASKLTIKYTKLWNMIDLFQRINSNKRENVYLVPKINISTMIPSGEHLLKVK